MNCLMSSVALAAALLANSPDPTSLGWETDYGRALNAAQSNDRPLLVVFEQRNAAQPRTTSVSTGHLDAFDPLLSPYELCRIDTSTPYGKQVAESFQARQFPYAVITDKTARQIIYRHSGKMTPTQWVATLVEYRDGRAPVVCFT